MQCAELASCMHFHGVRSYFETSMSKNRRDGKVVHDDRGNAIWDWAIETGVLARTSRGELANKLAEPARLTLEDDAPTLQTWDGDPYNRRAVG